MGASAEVGIFDPPGSRQRVTDIEELFAASRRILRALSRRVAEGDLEALAEMASLRDELEGCILEAVAGLRNDPELPASWEDIGRALGTTKQVVLRRYRKVGGARQPGGQPGNWR